MEIKLRTRRARGATAELKLNWLQQIVDILLDYYSTRRYRQMWSEAEKVTM